MPIARNFEIQNDSTALQVLIVEDSPGDFELEVHTLEVAGLSVHAHQVTTREEFQSHLQRAKYDVILANHELREWRGIPAHEVLRSEGNETPLILMGTALGEEKAVQCVKEGATNFILKTHLGLLPGAVRKAISEKTIKDTRAHADSSLRESESRFRALADSIASAVLIYQGTVCTYSNRAAQLLTGYSVAEMLELDSWDLFHPDSRGTVIERGISRLAETDGTTRFDAKILTKNGATRLWDMTLGRIQVQGEPAGLVTALDITERALAKAAKDAGTACDPLTGLLKKIHVQDAFAAEGKRSSRTGRPFAMVLLKLDNLEEIRVRSSSPEASRALCTLARVVGVVCRTGDVASRCADDEFLLLLPETAMPGACRLVHRLAEAIQRESDAMPLAVSAGIAVLPRDESTFDGAFSIAERMLKTIPMREMARDMVRFA
jgi:PAS domain S-box-containing protein/diguanylate cyclase (GGDEF)-like protein